MPRKLVVALEAGRGLDDARKRFTQPGSGPAAKDKLQTFRVAARKIWASPCAYPASPDHTGCRYLICEGYLFLYEVDPDTGSNASAGDMTIPAVFPPGFGGRARP